MFGKNTAKVGIYFSEHDSRITSDSKCDYLFNVVSARTLYSEETSFFFVINK